MADKDVSGKDDSPPGEIESFAASNIDDALAMLEVVNAKKDKASMGQQAAGLEKHPEVWDSSMICMNVC